MSARLSQRAYLTRPADTVTCPICARVWQRTKRQWLDHVENCSPACSNKARSRPRFGRSTGWTRGARQAVLARLQARMLLRPEEWQLLSKALMVAYSKGYAAGHRTAARSQSPRRQPREEAA